MYFCKNIRHSWGLKTASKKLTANGKQQERTPLSTKTAFCLIRPLNYICRSCIAEVRSYDYITFLENVHKTLMCGHNSSTVIVTR